MSRLQTGVLQMATRAVGWEEVVAAAASTTACSWPGLTSVVSSGATVASVLAGSLATAALSTPRSNKASVCANRPLW